MSTVSTIPDTGIEIRSEGGGKGVLRLSGDWLLRGGIPSIDKVTAGIASDSLKKVTVDAGAIGAWDSALLLFFDHLEVACKQSGTELDRSGLPDGARRLVALAAAVPERAGARTDEASLSLLTRIGAATVGMVESVVEALDFLGQATIALGRWTVGKARYRRSDLFLFVQQAGVDALPIVTLISFLVGAILAFVGAIQLQQFGASIYVANMVGIAMVREMGAMMTAIVMAGRTGAAYAAQLGSMKVNQEIDSLSTMGISPMEFLVLPRMLALMTMMPLLCLYSDIVGILGGMAVGVGMLHLSPTLYMNQTEWAVTLKDLFGGVFKATVYGVLVALAGCLRGMQSGNSSSAVGDATTAAVVTSIVLIISACGVFAVMFYVLGI